MSSDSSSLSPMHASETVENYLKAIHLAQRDSAAGEAAIGKVAISLGVTAGTATTMVKKLVAARLARHERFGGVRLTPKGTRAALDILRRHRLLETFLVDTLGLDWSVVHDEAERLEHAISPLVLDALDRHLGRPAFDPHGDPIPRADGALQESESVPMSELGVGDAARLVRVLDQRGESLRFLRASGLKVGTTLRVVAVEPGAGVMRIRPDRGAIVSMSTTAASRILVKPMQGRS